MNCPACSRANDPARRYCGRCGTNLVPTCGSCDFVNGIDDRYCGGCGDGLIAAARGTAPATPHPTVAAPAPAPVPVAKALASELDGLFSAPSIEETPSKLPEVGISQDHLDQLFGAIS